MVDKPGHRIWAWGERGENSGGGKGLCWWSGESRRGSGGGRVTI